MRVPRTEIIVSAYAKSMADALPSDIPPILVEGLVRVRVSVIGHGGPQNLTPFWSEPVLPKEMQAALVGVFDEVAKFVGPNLTPIEKP